MRSPTFSSIFLTILLGNLTSAFSTHPKKFMFSMRPVAIHHRSSQANSKPPATPSLTVRGGGKRAAASTSSEKDGGVSSKLGPASLWGTGGVIVVLLNAIRRVVPIALEPFKSGATPLSQFELAAYIITCLWFAYVEGYKGFQLKFSPLVVARSFTLKKGAPFHHVLLAPFYSMGLFHATKKRAIVSWSVTIGVAAIVGIVKRFPYPWRNIVDAGVVVGLTYGLGSIVVHYVKALVNGAIATDPALPKTEA